MQLDSLTLPSAMLSPFSFCYHTVTCWVCFCVCFHFQVPAVSRAGGRSYIVNFFAIHSYPSLPVSFRIPRFVELRASFSEKDEEIHIQEKAAERDSKSLWLAMVSQAPVDDDDNENQETLEPRRTPSTQRGSQRLSSPFSPSCTSCIGWSYAMFKVSRAIRGRARMPISGTMLKCYGKDCFGTYFTHTSHMYANHGVGWGCSRS